MGGSRFERASLEVEGTRKGKGKGKETGSRPRLLPRYGQVVLPLQTFRPAGTPDCTVPAVLALIEFWV